MRSTTWTITSLALSSLACGDSPTAPTREITLSFCHVWAAYQNGGEAWTVLPSASGAATFRATQRLAIATVSDPLAPFVEIHYLTTEQAEATFTCGAPQASTKRLNGSVAGVAAGGRVVISMGRNVVAPNATFPTFQISAVGDGPADLVATHHPPSPADPPSDRADKIIIRRGENYADGAAMPVLDFSSSETFAPQSNTLTLDGVTLGGTMFVQTDMTTQRGAYADLLFDIFYQGSAAVPTYSLPASRLADGDLHRAIVQTGGKRIEFFYRTPADRTVSFGPAASTPTFTTSGLPPDEVMRFDVAAQPEYGSQIRLELVTPQPSTSNTTIVITATKEYFGRTPTTWSLVVPDLTDLPGFSSLWRLSSGGKAWNLNVTGLPYGFSPASAHDGDVLRYAGASGIVQIP
jgi:hypothetical protein